MADDQEGRSRPPPSFTTLPIRACSDKRLTGTDLRVLGVIGFHDRRSLARGVGAGCFAGQRIIAQRAGLDRKNVRLSIERLVTLGYLERTERASEKRGYVLRVIEVDENAPVELIGGAGTPYPDGDNETVDFSEGVQEPPHEGAQEPPHRGLGDPQNRVTTDLAKARRDSPEGAHFSQSASACEGACAEKVGANTDAQSIRLKFSTMFAANVLGSQRELAIRSGVQSAYISRARNGLSIPAKAATDLLAACEEIRAENRLHCPTLTFGDFGYYLPADFADKEVPTQLALLEKAFKDADGGGEISEAAEKICDFLFEVCSEFPDGGDNQRALRMLTQLETGAYA
jgi:DNA-binding MarR family transcriptional regulator/transcriptional regulator with XRE-family HTH domain